MRMMMMVILFEFNASHELYRYIYSVFWLIVFTKRNDEDILSYIYSRASSSSFPLSARCV